MRRDASGLWVCPQEGPGKDGVTLTKGNADHLKAFAERLRVPTEITGRYGDISVTAILGGHTFDDTFGEEFG